MERRERINLQVKDNIKSLEGSLDKIEELNLHKKTKGFPNYKKTESRINTNNNTNADQEN